MSRPLSEVQIKKPKIKPAEQHVEKQENIFITDKPIPQEEQGGGKFEYIKKDLSGIYDLPESKRPSKEKPSEVKFHTDPEDEKAEPLPVGVCKKLPKNGKIVDKYGDKIGYVKRGNMYYVDDDYWGRLDQTADGVIVKVNGKQFAYLDANYNILTIDENKYVGTIRRRRIVGWIVAICILSAIILAAAGLLIWQIIDSREETTDIIISSETYETMVDGESYKLMLFTHKDVKNKPQLTDGSGAEFYFTVKNDTDKRVTYNLCFNDENMPDVPMVYDLKRDNLFIVGKTGPVFIEELTTTGYELDPGSEAYFSITWLYPDNSDNKIIENSAFDDYYITVEITVEE